MRVLLRIGVLFVVLLLIGLVAIAVGVPRLLRGQAVRDRIEVAAEDALGREFRYADLDFAWLPPSLLILDPAVAGDTPDAPPFARADRVAVRVALAPLLARAVVVDSFVVEGAEVRLVRDADGVSVPGSKSGPAESPSRTRPGPGDEVADSGQRDDVAPGRGDTGSATSDASEDRSVELAVRSVELRNATLVFEDRTVSPPHTLRLQEIQVSLRGESLEGPIPFEASAVIESGGALGAGGTATLDGDLDVTLELSEVSLTAFEPYFGDSLEAEGAVSGTITARGPVRGDASVAADLSLGDAKLRLNDIQIEGPVGIEAGIEGGFAEPRGRFGVDATGSDVRLGTAFHKPPGKPATVTGRIVTGAEGVSSIEDVDLQIGTAKARARVSLVPKTRVEAQVAPFDLGDLRPMVPALAEYRPEGPLRFDPFTVLTDPLDVRGKVHLDGVTAELPERGPVRATGSIEAVGDEIHTRDLVLVAVDQEVSVEASLTGLRGTPRYRVRTESQDADTNRLVSSLTNRSDTFFGPLDFDGEFSGVLGDEKPLASVNGIARFDITKGRIVGLSILHSLFNALGEAGASLGAAGTVALGASPLFTGKKLERYYGDEFELLAGSLRLRDGVASTDDLRLVYRDYSVDLRGTFDLEASKFRLLAELTLGEEIDEALAGGEVDDSKPPLVIPFPLRGRLDGGFAVGSNPTLDVNREVVASLVRRYGLDKHREDATKAIDDLLGKGAGDDVVDILDGILGGQRKKKKSQDSE